jgi:O-Antigen ligase
VSASSGNPRLFAACIAGLALLGALGLGALAADGSVLPVLLAVGAGVVCLGLVFASRLPAWFLGLLWALLLFYAVLGKGAANFNAGGVFIGEMVLAFGLLAALFGGVAAAVPYRSPLIWGIAAFGAWGAFRTVPYIATYRMDALRDAVTWGYGAFAILVAGAFARTGWIRRAIERYGKDLLWFPVTVPVVWALSTYARGQLPLVPGSGVPLVIFKSGDAAFHLMGVAAFILLGLHRPPAAASSQQGSQRPSQPPRVLLGPGGWVWWSVWFFAFGIAGAASRASIVAVVAGGGIILALRPSTRVWRPALTTIVMAVVFFASGVRVQVRAGRYLSASDMIANIRSVNGDEATGKREATREWRLEWWRTIIGYTIQGRYFWTGKGYGINLARDDGFVVGDRDRPLRSPHNGHLTILARSGVPGEALWLLLQGGFALALLRAYRRAVRSSRDWWARVNLWVLAYWATFVVNAAFEVSLEGPHGGIWFWSLFGFGIAALSAQSAEAALARRRQAPRVAALRMAPVGPARAAV